MKKLIAVAIIAISLLSTLAFGKVLADENPWDAPGLPLPPAPTSHEA